MTALVVLGSSSSGVRSRTVTTANGAQTTFPVSFPLPPQQGRAGVNVYVRDAHNPHPGTAKVSGVDYTWVSDGQISFTAAPANGLIVDVRRTTKDAGLDNTVQAGGSLKSAELVQNDTQMLYLIQEREDEDDDLQAQIDQEVLDRTSNQTTLFAQIGSILAAVGGGAVISSLPIAAASIAALIGLSTTSGLPALLIESGKTGVWVLQTYDATLAAADPLHILYAQSSVDATKMWARQYEGRINVQWAGAKLDNVTNDGPAVKACCDLSDALYLASTLGYGHGGGRPVYIPFGIAYMNATGLAPANSMRLLGNNSNGLGGAGAVSGMRWSAGTTGITIDNHGVSVENLHIIGAFAGVEGEFHGVLAHKPFYFTRCAYINWQGDGINYDCSGGNNVNNSSGSESWFQNNRNGIWNKSGADNSAMGWSALNFLGNREWGFKDESFLANGHSYYHADSGSLTAFNDGVNIGCSVTSSAGNRYFAINGQEVGASTNPPSGTTTDNTWWAYSGAGGASPTIGIIAWFSGILVRAGGSYYSPGVNEPGTWTACYVEGTQGLAQISRPAIVIGGSLAKEGLWKGHPGTFFAAAALQTGQTGLESNQPIVQAPREVTDETFKTMLGGSDGDKTLSQWFGSTTAVLGWKFLGGVDMGWSYGNTVFAHAPYKITGPTSTEQCGTGAQAPNGSFLSRTMYVGDDWANCRRLANAAAAPAPLAIGEIYFNRAPVASGAGSNVGWKATAIGTAVPYGGTAAHQANSVAPDVATVVADLNSLLAKLQAANLMA